MGIKKRVTLTVEVEMDIELDEEFSNLSPELIKDINSCGYSISSSDELYVAAAKLVLNGGQNSAWDVFGLVTPYWNKGRESIPDSSTFFDRIDLHVEDWEVV
ncbi:hypothetical protein B9T31_09690 [Acinetobacter sp. ANC 4558]|uniref:hypothetical protein n=1 Tax=Acinetobacter sp. ANC 4558 TaxID=1977876 RepID=UPI000A330D5E|nr:hypothetical protein [Acinetobacter sp. ANC 4558]OTG85855.1 hypothetical protein B9T31_09690 [Acinetobacter sp. ANC 4558]